ncbi:MAG: alpha/beta fold hydrolase [Anaerolineae bacterium]
MKASLFVTLMWGLLLSIGSTMALWTGNATAQKFQAVAFTSLEGDTLAAAYFPGTVEAGVLLLPDFNGNQAMMQPIASEFVLRGLHVFIFDYSGHGQSDGTMYFDDTRTNRIAQQVLAAKEEFKRLSGLTDPQIVVVGHGMGARETLQAATMDTRQVAGLILIGTQINLTINPQSLFFAGTSDRDLEWVQNLNYNNPPVGIVLISGTLDDILSPENAELLYDQLNSSAYSAAILARPLRFEIGFRTLRRIAGFHNFEIYHPNVIREVVMFAQHFLPFGFNPSYTEVTRSSESSFVYWRFIFWFTGIVGIFILLIGGVKYTKPKSSSISTRIEITSQRFVIAKCVMWFASVPLFLGLMAIFFVLPIPCPMFGLLYVGSIGAHGILTWLLYYFGKMPGTEGKLPFTVDHIGQNIRLTVALTFGLMVITGLYAATGWFNPLPTMVRLRWMVICVPIAAVGFWLGHHESRMIKVYTRGDTLRQSTMQGALSLINLLPFLVCLVMLALMGSSSNVIVGLQGLLILVLVILFGKLLNNLKQPLWVIAVAQATVLCWLILPLSALFSL